MEQRKKKLKPQLVPANDFVLEETALELLIPKALCKEVVNVQSEFTAEKIREGGYETVMWPLFGKVKVKVSKVHKLNAYEGYKDINKNTTIND